MVHLHMLWQQYLPTLKKKMRMPFQNDYSGHSAHPCSAVWDNYFSSLQAHHGQNPCSSCFYISVTITKWVSKRNKQ
jgi:hypothetical protein